MAVGSGTFEDRSVHDCRTEPLEEFVTDMQATVVAFSFILIFGLLVAALVAFALWTEGRSASTILITSGGAALAVMSLAVAALAQATA